MRPFLPCWTAVAAGVPRTGKDNYRLHAIIGSAYWVQRWIGRGVTNRLAIPDRPLPPDWGEYLANLTLDGRTLDDTQKQALTAIWTKPLSLVTGPAGSGKTTVIQALKAARDRYLDPALFPIQGAAPTGKAATRLKDHAGIPAKTVHRLFALNQPAPTVREGAFLDLATPSGAPWKDAQGGWLVVDEASMLDAYTAQAVLWGTSDKAPCQVVLLGDVNQLPPVGPGQVFIDLAGSPFVQKHNAVVTLTGQHRSGPGSDIARNALAFLDSWGRPSGSSETAQETKRNPVPPQMDLTAWKWSDAIQPLQVTSLAEAVALAERFARAHGGRESLEWQVICPIRSAKKALFGAAELSAAMFSDPSRGPLIVGDRVMQKENNYETDLMNGMQGIVQAMNEETVTVQLDNGMMVTVPLETAMAEWTKAWAITVHKAQGSEWKHVLLIIPPISDLGEGEEGNSGPMEAPVERRLFYTAITRAKETLLIAALNPEEVPVIAARTVRRSRNTGLPGYLNQFDGKKAQTNEVKLEIKVKGSFANGGDDGSQEVVVAEA